MTKYTSETIYITLFMTLDNLLEDEQRYLFENIFTEHFLTSIKDNPKQAYDVLNKIIVDIENNKTNKISTLLKPYGDKLYIIKTMLKNYGEF